MRDEGFVRYGVHPSPTPTPPGWHVVPADPRSGTPASSHRPDHCYPKCPHARHYLGVPL